MWKSGDRVSHRFNAELGPGLVVETEGRRIRVFFPETGETLQIAAGSDVLEAMELVEGGRAKIASTGEIVRVAEIDEDTVLLADGRELRDEDLWPMPVEPSPLQRLKRGQIDSFEDFRNRLDGLRLLRLRQADGLGSFLGGRIRLFPHQLYAAEKATAAMADMDDESEAGFVRWLLADEVGLGKTVEACLIMNRLLHRGRIERALVVVPDTLTVQWLGELWRKYHQIFVLLDTDRLKDVARDHGPDANPFEIHPRSIISLEALTEDRRLQEQAVEAGIDLLVVDEAHHLRRPSGHPGNPAYRAIRPITELGRHVLLLSATPLEDDAHGFFRLLQLLRPDELPEEDSFEERLARREPLPPCTSAARRADIGGMPPRIGKPVDLEASPEFEAWNGLIETLRQQPAKGPVELERKAERVWRATASAEALAALDDAGDSSESQLTEMGKSDPRVAWIVGQARPWAKQREKVLIFVAHKESLDLLRREVERQGRARVGVFHEDLSAERRDLEVAQFRLAEGPSILISTECGGEGRNFEFCDRLVLFDLPWHPAVVEQRIGRLDRIGRSRPTEIVYFRPPSGFVRSLALLYEAIGLFQEPLGGLERELRHVAGRVSEVALDGGLDGSDSSGVEIFQDVLDEAREATDRVRRAAYHELHREPYLGEMASQILERVPEELDAVTEDVVMRAAARFGFGCERQSGSRTWLIEYGSQALVDHIPGVSHGARFLGTFDRERAVEEEELDFFASGHALVEGILAELEDGPRGRVTIVQVAANEDTFGLLVIYRDGFDFEAVAVDQSGEERPELAAMLIHPSLITEPVDSKQWTSQPSWPRGIKRLAKGLPSDRRPEAVAAFRIRKRR